jgi:hypothetical protein
MSGYASTRTFSDAALVSQARRGDAAAFRTLVARHFEAVRLLASVMDAPPDLVPSTFDVARDCLQRESSDSGAIRPFLLRLARDLHRSPAAAPGAGIAEPCRLTPFRAEEVTRNHAVAASVSLLPPAWQTALWHRLVEQDGDSVTAAAVGVPPMKVPVLVHVALDLLQRNRVASHRKGSSARCLGFGLRLEREGLGVPPVFVRHAQSCARCAELLADLAALESELPRIMAQALLGDVAPGYLAMRGAVTATAPVQHL